MLDYEAALFEPPLSPGASCARTDTAEALAAETAARRLLPDMACDDIHLNALLLQPLQACLAELVHEEP
jgi:hypothetical protein